MESLRTIGSASTSSLSSIITHQRSVLGVSSSPSALLPIRKLRGRRLCRQVTRSALGVEEVATLVSTLDLSAIQHLLQHTPLALEPVVLPCSSYNCGDLIYRSTLDPELRREVRTLSIEGALLLGLLLAYLNSTPGVLQGAFDTYLAAPAQRLKSKVYTKDDIIMGKKLATGGFGTVYRAELVEPDTGETRDVIVKKATEFGEAEVWMNERMSRFSPSTCATFITAFTEGNKAGDPLWLVWQYEGDNTLSDMMARKEFPYNLEPLLFGRELDIPKGSVRKLVTVREVMRQLLLGLRECHRTGIVHRDVKPQNCIVSDVDRRLKLIDLGAAADLRTGINYVPKEFLLDPRYAPPQMYIMSTQTPKAPPAPVAALLSPILWFLNKPDRFDMYSCGLMLLQMAFPALRSDNALISFNRQLGERYNWDINAWRSANEGNRQFQEGFQLLDLDGGAGWDMLTQLVQYYPQDRLSVTQALGHPWFGAMMPLESLAASISTVGKALDRSMDGIMENGWLQDSIARNGTEKVGGFTEAQLSRELGIKEEAPPVLLRASTIAWWQSRQEQMAEKLENRELQRLQRKVNLSFIKFQRKAAQTIRGAAQRDANNGNGNGKVVARVPRRNGNGKKKVLGKQQMFTGRLWF